MPKEENKSRQPLFEQTLFGKDRQTTQQIADQNQLETNPEFGTKSKPSAEDFKKPVYRQPLFERVDFGLGVEESTGEINYDQIAPPSNTPICETTQGKIELEPPHSLFQKVQFGRQEVKDHSQHQLNIHDAQEKLQVIKNESEQDMQQEKSIWELTKERVQGLKQRLFNSQNETPTEPPNSMIETNILNPTTQQNSQQFEAEPYFDPSMLELANKQQRMDEVIETSESPENKEKDEQEKRDIRFQETLFYQMD